MDPVGYGDLHNHVSWPALNHLNLGLSSRGAATIGAAGAPTPLPVTRLRHC